VSKYVGRHPLGQAGMMRCRMDCLLNHGFVQGMPDARFSVDVATSELLITLSLQLRRYRTPETYHMHEARHIGCIRASEVSSLATGWTGESKRGAERQGSGHRSEFCPNDLGSERD
jgi:hypothetical protein